MWKRPGSPASWVVSYCTRQIASPSPWASKVIPDWTRAADGALTPSGLPAVFRSSAHAWFALRLVYLAEAVGARPEVVASTAERYRREWDRFVQHGADMQHLVNSLDRGDLDKGAIVWNGIDQHEVDAAFTTSMCEREPYGKASLLRLAQNRYDLRAAESANTDGRDKKLTPAGNEAAWQLSPGGACRGCGTPTISQRQYDRARKALRSHPDLFDLSPSYRQHNGREAPLRSSRILIAAKGVADHLVPWSQGGRSDPDNLMNVCAPCNYTRKATSLDVVRVAAYT